MNAFRLLVLLSSFSLILACSENIKDSTVKPLILEVEDYFENDIPFGNPDVATPASADAQASIGRLLFYDNRLSYNNSTSCATCHKQSRSFSDDQALSDGLYNEKTERNSMALVNTGYQRFIFWEGHRGHLNEHVLNPISNHLEMGMRSNEDLVEKLLTIDEYKQIFEEVYLDGITEENIGKSLGRFVSAMISYNSKFDKGSKSDFTNFNVKELRGKDLFFGKAKCGGCHRGEHFVAQWRSHANIGLDLEYADEGSGNGEFKIPTLRNIEFTGPYMHDGRFETLEEVIEHYSENVKDHPQLDWALNPDGLGLSETEKDDLKAFLLTLSDYDFISDHRFSNPF